MQLANPIDIEDALRIDLAALLPSCRVYAPPIPPDLKAGDVVVVGLGGSRMTGVSHEYSVSIDVYEQDESQAVELANSVHGIVSSLPIRNTLTQYSAVSANVHYSNPDQRAPQLVRQTFRAEIIAPGERITI